MKTTKLILIIAGALALVGCGTPVQQAAQVGASTGNLYAEYVLSKNPGAVAALQLK